MLIEKRMKEERIVKHRAFSDIYLANTCSLRVNTKRINLISSWKENHYLINQWFNSINGINLSCTTSNVLYEFSICFHSDFQNRIGFYPVYKIGYMRLQAD